MSIGKIKWQTIVSKYAYPETWRSLWQVVNSVIPFFVLWYLAYRSLEIGYWLTLPITVLAAGFMVRMFIIFHDCCHGSFFRTPLANDRFGLLLGAVVWEVHNGGEVEDALSTATELIGINNRNLSTYTIDRSITRLLSESIRSGGRTIVSESGIVSRDDIREMKPYCDAFLIGSSIISHERPEMKLEEFVCA